MTTVLLATEGRERSPLGRWPMRGIVAGGLLMTGPFWGFAVTLIGVWRAFALMDRERAPEPEEIFRIMEVSRMALFVAVGAFAVGAAAVVWSSFALARSRASRAEAGEPVL